MCGVESLQLVGHGLQVRRKRRRSYCCGCTNNGSRRLSLTGKGREHSPWIASRQRGQQRRLGREGLPEILCPAHVRRGRRRLYRPMIRLQILVGATVCPGSAHGRGRSGRCGGSHPLTGILRANVPVSYSFHTVPNTLAKAPPRVYLPSLIPHGLALVLLEHKVGNAIRHGKFPSRHRTGQHAPDQMDVH